VKKSLHKGRPSTVSHRIKNYIVFMFKIYREQGICISAKMLALDAMREFPDLHQVPETHLRCRLLLFLKKEEFITHRHITHMAQNVRHYQDIVNDFIDYFNRQIVTGKYRVPCIVNMDKTNLDFDMTPRTAVLQPLNKDIFKPFKEYYYELQNNWIISHAEGQKPTRLDVATWVNTAWNSFTVQSITNTWESINFLPYIDH
jgi:hypothetical protein